MAVTMAMLARMLLYGLSIQLLLATHFVYSSVPYFEPPKNGINYKNKCPIAKGKYHDRHTVVTYRLEDTVRDFELACEYNYKGLWHTHFWFTTETDKKGLCYNTRFTFNNESIVRGRHAHISTDLYDPRVTLFVESGCYINFTLTLSYYGYNDDVFEMIARQPTESPYEKKSTPSYYWWQVWREDSNSTGRELNTFRDHNTKKTVVALIASGCTLLVIVLAAAILVIIIKRRRNQRLQFHLFNAYDNPNFQKSLSIETVTGKEEKSSSKTFGQETSDIKPIIDYQEVDTIDT